MTSKVNLFHVGCVRIGADIMPACAQDCADKGAKKVLILTSAPIAGLAKRLCAELHSKSIEARVWEGPDGEPTRKHFHDALAFSDEFGSDFIIGLGGGSAMDVAKLVAALTGSSQSFDEIVGSDLLEGRPLPLACIPTTAGTGSEVTPIAILEDEEAQLKKGVVSRHLVPDYAYLDPQLTVTMPRGVTASTGIDALTHCIEAYTNVHAHPVVDSWALEGIHLIAKNLVTACNDPDDLPAREAMLLGSHLGGMCLGPVNTAAVHALAYPLGGEFHIPHGVANSLLLPHVMHFNMSACAPRYAKVAHAMGVAATGDDIADAKAGIALVEKISADAGIQRRLSDVGIEESALAGMANMAMTVQRLLQNNPRKVTESDALRIYEAAF